MAAKQLPLPGGIVKKSNALCRARWEVDSLYEPRLVALTASKVKRSDLDFQEYEIPLHDIIGDAKGGKTYKIVESIIDNLMSKVITIRDGNSASFIKYNIFSKCAFDSERNVVIARFDPDLKPHFLGLKEKFTEYSLLEFLKLPSIYSQRLYEILKSWDDVDNVTIPLSDLHDMLSTPISMRKTFGEFRRRVLDKAYIDITSRTELKYVWTPIKSGRNIVAVDFIFSLSSIEDAQEKLKSQKREQSNIAFKDAIQCWNSKEEKCDTFNDKKEKCILCQKLLQKKP